MPSIYPLGGQNMRLAGSIGVYDSLSETGIRMRSKNGFLTLYSESQKVFMKVTFRDSTKVLKLTDNIKKLFTRNVKSGCLTIRVEVPAKDVMIQEGVPEELCEFVKILETIYSNQPLPERIFTPKDVSFALLKASDRSKLHVARRQDYPVGTGFSPRLREFIARNLKLRSFDSRLHALTGLRFLDLGGNLIKHVPEEIQSLGLVKLVLDNNKIDSWPSVQLDSPLARALESIDLSFNTIEWLPDDFWNMENIVSANLSHLGLRGLPVSRLHLIKRLTELQINSNRLTSLPFALVVHRNCRLSVMDNVFTEVKVELPAISSVPTLQGCASLTCARKFSASPLLKIANVANYFVGEGDQYRDAWLEKYVSFLMDRLPWHLYIRFAVLRTCICCRSQCGLEPTRLLLQFPQTCHLCADRDNYPCIIAYLCGPLCYYKFKSKPWRYELG